MAWLHSSALIPPPTTSTLLAPRSTPAKTPSSPPPPCPPHPPPPPPPRPEGVCLVPLSINFNASGLATAPSSRSYWRTPTSLGHPLLSHRRISQVPSCLVTASPSSSLDRRPRPRFGRAVPAAGWCLSAAVGQHASPRICPPLRPQAACPPHSLPSRYSRLMRHPRPRHRHLSSPPLARETFGVVERAHSRGHSRIPHDLDIRLRP